MHKYSIGLTSLLLAITFPLLANNEHFIPREVSIIDTSTSFGATNFPPLSNLLFAGTAGNSALPTNTQNGISLVNLTTNEIVFNTLDVQSWGAAADPENRRILFSVSSNGIGSLGGDELFALSYDGGTPQSLGIILDPLGESLRMDGLAVIDGQVFAALDGAPGGGDPDGLYAIDLTTMVAELAVSFTGVGGIEATPSTGRLFGTNDDESMLVEINITSGEVTNLAPYPDKIADIDALAATDELLFLVSDEEQAIQVFDLNTNSFIETLPAVFTISDTFAGAAFASEPNIIEQLIEPVNSSDGFPNTFGNTPFPAFSNQLFAGTATNSSSPDDTQNGISLINPATGDVIFNTTDAQTWGAAADPNNRRMLFSVSSNDTNSQGGDLLFSLNYDGGLPELLGSVIDPLGTPLRMDGLAILGDQLLATLDGVPSRSTPDGLYLINLDSMTAELAISLTGIGGLEATPSSNRLFGTNDDDNLIVEIDISSGTIIELTTYPDGITDIDSLAANDDLLFLISDEAQEIQVYDLNINAYLSPLPAPFLGTDVFAGASFASEPNISEQLIEPTTNSDGFPNTFGSTVFPPMSNRIFIGSADNSTDPTNTQNGVALLDIESGQVIFSTQDIQAWGVAADPDNRRIIFSVSSNNLASQGGDMLFILSYDGGLPEPLGTVTGPAGTPLRMDGLAFSDGQLLATLDGTPNRGAPDGLYQINLNTMTASQITSLTGIGGLDAIPNTVLSGDNGGRLFGTNDDTQMLVEIDRNSGAVIDIAAYPSGLNDIDALATSNESLYLIAAEAQTIQVFDLASNTFTNSITMPLNNFDTFVGAAIAIEAQLTEDVPTLHPFALVLLVLFLTLIAITRYQSNSLA